MHGAITTILAVFTVLSALGGFSETASAQLVREHDAQGLRSFHGAGSRIRRSFQSDSEAREILKQILAVSGLAGMDDRITLRASAETDNAEAFVEKASDKEERLIFYNAVFMQEIANKTKDYWSMVAILAHEVGHHIRLHTIIPGRDHEFELEADYQAGFILRRMGATLEQTQAAFRTVGADAATASHPPRAQRVQAATLGWTDGVSLQPRPVPAPTVTIPAPSQVAVPPAPITSTSHQQGILRPTDQHPFDGVWKVEYQGGPGCHVKALVNNWTISNSTLRDIGHGTGQVSNSGSLQWRVPSMTGSAIVSHWANLKGNQGSGGYAGGSNCLGTTKLTRQ